MNISPEQTIRTDLRRYLNEIGKFPLMTREEEKEIGKRAFKGDRKAIEEMVNRNLRLVVSIAGEYAWAGTDILDLIQEGSAGLCIAAKRFNPDMKTNGENGAKFSTYAQHWIRQHIRRYLSNKGRNIRIPVAVLASVGKIAHARADLEQQGILNPTDKQLMRRAEVSPTIFKRCQMLPTSTSADSKIGEGEDDMYSLIPNDEPEIGEELSGRDNINDLVKAMSILDKRSRYIIKARFGLLKDDQGETLQQVGDRLGISREMVRQIERDAMLDLRAEMRRLRLVDEGTIPDMGSAIKDSNRGPKYKAAKAAMAKLVEKGEM